MLFNNNIQARIWFLAFGLFLFCASLDAQNAIIKGTVTDGESGGGLPGTTVFLKDSPIKGTTTDIDGNYTFSDLPAGALTVVFSFIGFQEQEVVINTVNNEVVTQDVALSYTSVLGEEVLVTAQALGQAKAINQQLNAESIANIVSGDRIQELPDVNAAEAVARLPGVSINRSGGEGSKVVIRGLEPKFNAITVNGIRLPANAGNDRSVDLSLISPELLDGIEVYKSPLPDMDAEAVGGTVNLRLRKAPKERAFLARGLFGYNDINNYFGDYKGVLQYSQRFFKSKLGFVAQGNLERFNRGGDITSLGWGQGPTDEVSGVTAIEGRNLRLEDRAEQRRRNNASLSLDYEAGKSSFGFFGLYSNTSRDQFIQQNRYQPGDGIQYIANGIESDLTLFLGTLTGIHTVGSLEIDWVASASRSNTDTPYDFTLRVNDDQRGFDPELNELGNPFNYLEGANPDLRTAYLNDNINDATQTLENNQEYGLNLKLPFDLSDKVGGYLKVGGRYRSIDRTRDVNSIGENFYYLGGEFTRTAAEAFDGDLIFSEANPQQISLNNFVVDGQQVDFEDRNGEQVDFDVVMNEGLIRNWFEQQRDVLQPNRNSRVDNFDVQETVRAAYMMAKINLGKKLSITPGVRYEYSDNQYQAGVSTIINEFAGVEGSFRDTMTFQEYGEILPHLHIKYEPKNWLDVRFSYATTLARPDYSFITPRVQINDNSLTITAGNPELQHMRVQNYDLSLTAYKGGLGLASIGVFYKDVENIFIPQSLQLVDGLAEERGFGNRPEYLLNSFSNFPQSEVYGFEIDLQTNLSFLPAPFNGLVANINYARLFSQTTTFFLTSESFFFPFFRVEYESNAREVAMPSQVPHILNLSIGYDFKKFSARVSGIYQGTNATLYNQNKDFDRFTMDFWRWDASMKQRIGQHFSLFLNVNNFTNQRDVSFIRDERFLSSVQIYGMTATVGAQYKL